MMRPVGRRLRVRIARIVVALFFIVPAHASVGVSAGTDLIVPAVAQAQGLGGAVFQSTLWITNTSPSAVSVEVAFLQTGTANPAPPRRTVLVAAGATLRYDNVLRTLFQLDGVAGALRLRSSGPLLASSRTVDLAAGAPLKDAKGLYLAAVPAEQAVGIGEVTWLQGVSNGPGESLRYNFGLVEVAGGPVDVDVIARDESGAQIAATRRLQLGENGRLQVNGFGDFTPAVSVTNGLVEFRVVGGTGRVVAFGTQVMGTNDDPGSNDSVGFEMAFRPTAAAVPGVTSLNSLRGDVALVPGSNVAITPSGNNLHISATVPPGISGVYAGPGLTGGGSSGDVTLSVGMDGIAGSMIRDGAIRDSKRAGVARFSIPDGATQLTIANQWGEEYSLHLTYLWYRHGNARVWVVGRTGPNWGVREIGSPTGNDTIETPTVNPSSGDIEVRLKGQSIGGEPRIVVTPIYSDLSW